MYKDLDSAIEYFTKNSKSEPVTTLETSEEHKKYTQNEWERWTPLKTSGEIKIDESLLNSRKYLISLLPESAHADFRKLEVQNTLQASWEDVSYTPNEWGICKLHSERVWF